MFGWIKKKVQKQAITEKRPSESLSGFIPLCSGEERVLPGEYAMWFPTPEDTQFSASSALGQIERLYRASSGMEEVLYAAILCRLGAIDGNVTQLALPEEGAVFPVLGSSGQGFLLSASEEKGIRLHFHRSTPTDIRTNAMEEIASRLEEWRQIHGGASTEPQTSPHYAGEGWWSLMKQAASEIEARHEPLLSIGKILY